MADPIMPIIRPLLLLLLLVASCCVSASTSEEAIGAFQARRFPEAVRLWELDADQGNSESQFQLGVLFSTGKYVARDIERAKSYLRLAVAASHREAAYALAAIYASSDPAQPDEVIRLLSLAERLGDEDASASLLLIKQGLPQQHALRLARAAEKQDALLSPRFSPTLDTSSAAIAAGAQIAKRTCNACHTTGAAGAPLVGNPSNWKRRNGDATAIAERIVRGFKACPPRGGDHTLTDDQVRSAVLYMLRQIRR